VRSIQITDATAQLSALLEAAERGQPTTIIRDGKPAAALVSVANAQVQIRNIVRIYSATTENSLAPRFASAG
jgi:prevent-host-death family protein